MSIRKKILIAGVLAAMAMPAASLITDYAAVSYASPATETQASDAFTADLKNGSSPIFEASDGWTNGNPFNVLWHKENVTFEDVVNLAKKVHIDTIYVLEGGSDEKNNN